MITERSEKLYTEACGYMPGGVNSPVRACRSVGTTPLFIERAKGSRIWDEDGNEFIDYVCSWGPNILGHACEPVISAVKAACEKGLTFGACHKSEIELARLIRKHFLSMEMLRLVNSGTEAVMSAIRAARGFTGRDKIIKFEGCYHGHSDGLLVKAGSGLMTQSIPSGAGVTEGCTRDTLLAKYNDESSVRALFDEHGGEIAALIVEPCAANMGVVPPKEGFFAVPARHYRRARSYADIRRSYNRLSPFRRRRAEALRRNARPHNAWQDSRRRNAAGGLRRQARDNGVRSAARLGISGGHAFGQPMRGSGGHRDAKADREHAGYLRSSGQKSRQCWRKL